MEKRKRVGNYRLGRTLGKGAFGKVKAGVHVESGATVAIKILKKEDVIENGMTEQITILKKLNHPNIVNMVDVMATKSRIYIVQELVTGGELLYHLATEGKFKESAVKRYFKQLIEALDFCHRAGVVHRDIKPENLLVTDSNNIKITDFGLSVSNHESHLKYQAAGTPAYLAPEVLRRNGYDGRRYPFTDPDLLRKIERCDVTYPYHISAGAKDLLCRIFVADPQNRITTGEILKHDWMIKNNENDKSDGVRKLIGDLPHADTVNTAELDRYD
ncbi:CBL-interacting serine/threonine-protein kinase 23 [Blyttiomyces sp. JEL0837]|nr:CBL-interacting serine/threonine-protein kinase 23 [Blyttiomyces sp. JEL0837]